MKEEEMKEIKEPLKKPEELEELTEQIINNFSKNPEEFKKIEGNEEVKELINKMKEIKEKYFKKDTRNYEMLDFIVDLRSLIIFIIKLFTSEDVAYMADEKIERKQVKDLFTYMRELELSEDSLSQYYNKLKDGLKKGTRGERMLRKKLKDKKDLKKLEKVRKKAEKILIKKIEPYLDIIAYVFKTETQ